MSNVVEFEDKIAFHPGYYIKETIEAAGLTQEDFAKRLGTTPKNLSILVRGEQNLSIDIAVRLASMLGTSIDFWLNLQKRYEQKVAEIMSAQELSKEREIFKLIDYGYFRKFFGLPDLPRKVDEQIKAVREFLSVASLTVLDSRDFSCSFRSEGKELSRSNVVNANVMVQIAINKALARKVPKYDKGKFEKAVDFALTQTMDHRGFLSSVEKAFESAGVVLVSLPNIQNSKINGATKRLRGKVLVMVNDRRHYWDTFWFTLMHEVGHVLQGDFGISSENEEDAADRYARSKLVPDRQYQEFLSRNHALTVEGVQEFAMEIGRDPGIVLGRLLKDGVISYANRKMCERLRRNYEVCIPD
ncbi:MAG: HigA family addiction module antidote protein [Duodenibacillus sp.]|nr:HigA family addiction module antidote protein [Duodenibacillus sp.]